MSFKCIHIADVHFRGLTRHDEYRNVFNQLFEQARQMKPDVIFVGGDIVHTKTQGISPELIDILSWWFTSLSRVAPTHVTLGNHDGLIQNHDRLDAITPIVEALNNPRIFLYKKSGVYETGVKGFNWCVFSCFDHENWSKVKPVEGQINIATFHGAVRGSLTDVNWELEGEVDLSFFEKYDFAFLGDIHKMQYLDFEKKIAYSGSTIQQNYGESVSKGFLFWEINSKNDYRSTFYELKNPSPFVTVEWQETFEKTIVLCEKFDNCSRFRIKSKQKLDINNTKLIQNYLKTTKNAVEVIFKHDGVKNSAVLIDDTKKKFNIWDNDIRLGMLCNFFDKSVTSDQIAEVNNLFNKYLQNLSEDQSRKPYQWQIKNLEFDNIFSYGEGNHLNFDNMNGVVGIFGKNAIGKSSITAALMYTLFNATDRGSMKNLHIINHAKESCLAKLIIEVNNNKYLIERSTKKVTNKKKNEVYAPTELSLKRLTNIDTSKNETDEQRRETEKILRDLIGTADEFLMTTFASQGNINAFINEKSGNRKHFISKFLNLEIFEELQKIAKEDSNDLKTRLKVASEKNWFELKNQAQTKIDQNLVKIYDLEVKIDQEKTKEIEVRLCLENLKNKNHDLSLLKSLQDEIQLVKNMIAKDTLQTEKLEADCIEIQSKIEKFLKLKEIINISELENDRDRLINLKAQLTMAVTNFENLRKEIDKKKNAHKLLSSVPCGDSFPTCRFIKNAYEDFQNITQSEDQISQLEKSITELKSIVDEIENRQVNVKIERYYEHLSKNTQNELQLNLLQQNKNVFQQKIDDNQNKLETLNQRFEKVNEQINSDDVHLIKSYQSSLNLIKSQIDFIDTNLSSLRGENVYLQKNIENCQLEEEKQTLLINQWKIYELFINCVSKKGLPSTLLKEMLPSLNKEVKEILSDIVDFTVDIEIHDDDLEIYLNQHDQRRIIETASGMEKMITSLAIRVGLINISNLPKSNIFIIDEGFGALDDTNIGSCIKLLESFKRFFKTILIISHVDAVKDAVDNTIYIEKVGSDSYVRFE